MTDHLKATLDALPDLLFEVDETGRIFDYRALQPESLVVSPEEFMGKRMDEVLPAEPAKVINRAIEEAMVAGHHSGSTYSLQMPDGLRWYELSIAVKDKSDPHNIRLIVLARDITDRKRSEEALAESEEKFRTLAEVTDAMIFIYRNQQTIYANPAATAITGYSLEELLKINFMEFIHPDFHEVVSNRIKSRMAGKRGLSKLELKINRKGGEERWLSYSADLIQFQGERAVLGTAFDITDHKTTEQALHESETMARLHLEELEHMYANIPAGMSFVDENLRYIRINERLAEWNGKTVADHLGKSVGEVLPELRDSIEPMYRRVFETGEPILGNEVTGPMPNDPTRNGNWIVDYFPVKRVDDSVTGVGAVVTDVTARTEVEEALKQSQALTQEQLKELEQMYANIPVGLGLMDTDLRYVRINERLAEVNGVPVADHLGRTVEEVIPALADHIVPHMKKVIESGKAALNMEVSAISPSDPDSLRDWLVSYYPVRDADDKVQGLGIVVAEITEQKEAEMALARSEKLAVEQLEELETVYRNIPVGLCLIDRDFRHIRINEQLAQFNQRSIEEHLGLTVAEVVPDLAPRIEPILQSVLDTGEPVLGLELSGPSPTDPTLTNSWVLSCYPVKAPDDTVQGIGVVVADITERKRNEELLTKMTEELKSEREELQKKNTALKEILFSLEQERRKFKSLIARDIQQAITPFLDKLLQTVGKKSAEEIDRLDKDIKAILTEDVDKFRERYAGLTSREFDVCEMIKDGMSSKEISAKLDLSVLTIHKHREQIRKKLGIANRKVNLSTYLRLHV